MQRTTKPKEPEIDELAIAEKTIAGTSLDIPMTRCYACKSFVTKGRVIGKEGLAICYKCDVGVQEEKAEPIKLTRGTEAKEIPIEEARCHFCGELIINEKRIAKKLKSRTASGSLSERDKRRLEHHIRAEGWRRMGPRKFCHTKCVKKV
jgi:hypothetical protein